MRKDQLAVITRLQNSDFNDTKEIVEAVLAVTQASFATLADGKIGFADAAVWIMVFGPIQRAIDQGQDIFRELAGMANDAFDATFEEAAANFDLVDNSTEHDVKGMAKGILHVVRIYSRRSMKAVAA